MLHFFTDPYKDELIYSAIARYHYYTGNVDFKDTLEELFGKRTIIPNFEIGSNIEALAKGLGGKYSSDYIINKHTIFPFYSAFLPKKRRQQILKGIKFKGKGLYTSLGVISGSICRKKHIYYCPICAKEEIAKYGEAYIHREHQLQGIFLCCKHGIRLIKYPISKKDVSRLQYIRLNMKLLKLETLKIKEVKYEEQLLKIARDAYYIITEDLSKFSKEDTWRCYKSLLYDRGLITPSGKVKQRELYEEFTHFYSSDVLSLLQSSVDYDNEYNWLKVITRNEARAVHPIRHLLLINFLEGDISKFFKGEKYEYKPFGKGPWPCLNIVSEHYKKEVITSLEITEDYKTKALVGTFTCSCGFVYSRKGPDKTEGDRYKAGRIKRFGEVWENSLKELITAKKYGLREIGRSMNCDPKTVVRYADKLGIKAFLNTKLKLPYSKKKHKNKKTITGEAYKKEVIDFIKDNKISTKQQIRNSLKKQYIWLYRHNKIWLQNNLPDSVPREKRNNKEGTKVDWDKRDAHYLKLLKNKRASMLNQVKPIRITKSSLGREIGILAALEKNIDKLPKTKEYLRQVTETVEEFQLRRCIQIIDNKIKEDENIKLWQLQRKAGIRTKAFNKLKKTLINYINTGGEKWGERKLQ
ncbi:TnsD family Tn7-like transposition protein [Clostridium felsineum]|uniref:Transposon Tn7 transposition protein TnsD C-termianl domain-containing protein n=1 Tax=Clostridium felsineum TaxID=36839 RepID=A0A1S8LIN8_9CLOT|nr:TnsD family Tn7-like transposition protein [Clostridium felsineum]URZ04698.1 hypothetical protein CLROS_000070 [Clostridium felsineum]URZ09671.1 hypothetical protein CROST_003640 [Clostridium felsineum]